MATSDDRTPAELIDARIDEADDWRGDVLDRVRSVIREAVPDIEEQVKWVKPTNPLGVPVWESDGILCTGEVYKDKVKLTFANGAALDDPDGLFNSSLNGNVRRAIDIHEDDRPADAALASLVQAAASYNASKE